MRRQARRLLEAYFTDPVVRYSVENSNSGRTGRLNIYQTLLLKPESGKSGLPLSRADWYA